MNELVKIENNEIVIKKELVEKIINFERYKKEIEYQEQLLKDGLLELMPKLGKSTLVQDGLSITYRKPSTRKTFDSKRLKEERPDVYDNFTRTSETKSSITIKVSD